MLRIVDFLCRATSCSCAAQQVLAPLLMNNTALGQQSRDAAAACFAAAAAILASVGRSAAGGSGSGSSHLDERLAEAALCAIGIALSASEAPGTLTVSGRAIPACVKRAPEAFDLQLI